MVFPLALKFLVKILFSVAVWLMICFVCFIKMIIVLFVCSDARVMWDQKTGRSRGFGFVSFRSQQVCSLAFYLTLFRILLTSFYSNSIFLIFCSGCAKCNKWFNWWEHSHESLFISCRCIIFFFFSIMTWKYYSITLLSLCVHNEFKIN